MGPDYDTRGQEGYDPAGDPPEDQYHGKPEVQLTGQDGNVFNLIGVAAKALRRAGQPAQASEMTARVFRAHSYDEALGIIQEYVDAR